MSLMFSHFNLSCSSSGQSACGRKQWCSTFSFPRNYGRTILVTKCKNIQILASWKILDMHNTLTFCFNRRLDENENWDYHTKQYRLCVPNLSKTFQGQNMTNKSYSNPSTKELNQNHAQDALDGWTIHILSNGSVGSAHGWLKAWILFENSLEFVWGMQG